MYRILLIAFVWVLLAGVNLSLKAASTTATTSGSWSTGSNWSDGVPGCGDTIFIPAGITITLTVSIDLEACTSLNYIEVAGTLNFQTGKKLYLPCGSTVYLVSGGSLTKGGGGGSSNLIDVCSSNIWSAGDGNVSGPQYVGSGLPIKLQSFEGSIFSDGVQLNWTTISEINNDYFTIERSLDLRSVHSLTTIPGAGDSRAELNYDYFDANPLDGVNYYRLKQTDFDGRFSYSNWIAVSTATLKDQIRIRWQEDGSDVFIHLSDLEGQECRMVLSDLGGQIFWEESLIVPNDRYSYSINLKRFNVASMILCKVSTGRVSASEKIINLR